MKSSLYSRLPLKPKRSKLQRGKIIMYNTNTNVLSRFSEQTSLVSLHHSSKPFLISVDRKDMQMQKSSSEGMHESQTGMSLVSEKRESYNDINMTYYCK